MTSRALVLVAVALAVVAVCDAGCESVPEIRFVTADAASDAAKDGAGTSDSGTDSSTPDAPVCSAPPPAGGTCCGDVWCLDQCGPANCDECARKGCAPGELCCGKMGTVQCKPRCP